MKNKIKLTRILIILMSLLFSNIVFADDTIYTEGSLKYTINNGEVKIVEYFGKESEVKVPLNMGQFYVTEIGPNAFKDDDIEKISLPYTITSLEANSFKNINNIKIESFDTNDEIIENNVEIIYPKQKPTINNYDNSEITVENTDISESFDISDTEELFNNDIKEEIINNETIDNTITYEKGEEDINPLVITNKEISLNLGSYLFLSLFVLILLIFIVLVIKNIRRKRYNN